jgi:hypothetical protein
MEEQDNRYSVRKRKKNRWCLEKEDNRCSVWKQDSRYSYVWLSSA